MRWTSLRRAGALLVWLLLYLLVAPLAAITRRRRGPSVLLLVLLALLLTVLASRRGCSTPVASLRVATFNIRNYGASVTDETRLTALLRELDADVIAVQEIQDPQRFATAMATVGGTRRDYAVALSQCGGRRTMHVGFVYDRRRITLRAQREYPELDPDAEGRCVDGDRPGLLGRFALGARAFDLLVVHFAAGGDAERHVRRREQWNRALAIITRLRTEGSTGAAILGDTNSTGFLDDSRGERTFINERLARDGMRLLTSNIGCSEYYAPNSSTLEPSLLDHIAVTDGFPTLTNARVHGYCALYQCRPLNRETPPDDYRTVSDHCPVSVGD